MFVEQRGETNRNIVNGNRRTCTTIKAHRGICRAVQCQLHSTLSHTHAHTPTLAHRFTATLKAFLYRRASRSAILLSLSLFFFFAQLLLTHFAAKFHYEFVCNIIVNVPLQTYSNIYKLHIRMRGSRTFWYRQFIRTFGTSFWYPILRVRGM